MGEKPFGFVPGAVGGSPTLLCVESYVLRVWLPDRPGALGAVASRIGAVKGDVVGIEILETGAGQAVDELVVNIPDATVIDLLVNEVVQVDGVKVEEVRPSGSEEHDPRLAGLEAAYAGGVRQLQLVHFARNAIGDFQTEAPAHGGLTAFGRDVIREANRLGILIDLAHATRSVVEQTLEISRAPVVWSHSSISRGEPSWRMPAWRARQISVEEARAIAAKEGVVGLWSLPSDVGRTVDSYADRILQMAQLLGDEHVAFGTDMNAIANSPINSYADLRRAVKYMEAQGVEPSRLRKISIGNYARVLRAAMVARKS